MLRPAVVLMCVVTCILSAESADDTSPPAKDGNRLAYLDECNPWYPHKDFPKLITPQWVGEEGVEAVIVLAIDDMRDPAKYEQYLRPILNRLKQIDGRAPVSIMTCDVKPDDPQLQSWLGEGLSIECHTIDHPCPILQGGDFDKAKSTYDRCVDLMGKIPGNKPVAFRTPCCDSLNTVSPRFFAEIFNSTTKDGNFLQIDSSVFTFFTSEDESLPKELVLDANGNERFWKYLPKNNKYGGNTHNNFVNYIKNYPYPYVINNSCWEIPCIAPSDWSAQHLHGINNPITVEDWKAAIDLTVHKRGCFGLVFHPHGWIKPEQVVEMIDHAVVKHGKKVKFLNFKEVAERLNKADSGKLRGEWAQSALKVEPPRNLSAGLSPLSVDSDSQLKKWWAGDSLAPPYGLLPIRGKDDKHNGFFVHDRHFCWINEDTATLPDLMHRVSFDEVLAKHEKASGRASALRGDVEGKADSGEPKAEEQDSKSQISNLKSADPNTKYDPVSIGAAVVDITPDYPIRLTGYGNRMKESDSVAAKIHARALVIGQSRRHSLSDAPAIHGVMPEEPDKPSNDGVAVHHSESDGYFESRTILITVDNCGVPIEITEAVYDRIAAKHNIARERFAISSTHSHSAPWLRGFAPNIFAEIPDDHAAHLAQYEKDLTDKLVDVVEKAIACQRPGHLSYGYGEAGFAMNRRALTDGKWSGFGEVPDGPTDNRVPVLAAHDVDGNLIAVLANYACHCTTETGEFNQISGDWAGFAADMLEAEHPGAVALIAIGCGADANPSPRGTHEQAKVHGRSIADEVKEVLASGRASALRVDAADAVPETDDTNAHGGLTHNRSPNALLHRINPNITCNMVRIDLPLGPLPSRDEWEQQAKEPGVTGSRARFFLKMLDEGNEIPTTIPNYPVQTWCFGQDLAMVFLGGEVVVDYSIRMNDMFDGDRLWINAYSNDVPCYIASARVLREGGYECDSSMLYYRRPTRLAPEAEDVLCDAVQKIMPHEFYSEKLQQDFPAPKSPEESLKCMTTKPDLRVVLAASEPLIRDPVAFDWDERGRLWVVEMGDYPSGDPSPKHTGRVQMLEDTDKDGVYDKATTFLDGLAFPNGIHCWRGGVIVTMAPEIFYAEDTDGDGKADVRETMYKGFVEGNQQHRINGLRWGLDGWLYLANGDSGGEIAGTGFIPGLLSSPLPRAGEEGQGEGAASNDQAAASASNPRIRPSATLSPDLGGEGTKVQPVSLRGRDLRINPDTNELDAVSGQTQFGRERDDFGNWFGNNNSNPIWQYVLEDRYVRRNPHAGISQVTAAVSVIPGAAPVYPTSRTLARFNDFAYANRFTSACSTMIYRDNYLGDQYYGNAFTSEPVHNLVSRLVLTREGYSFKGERAADEQESEFLASSDNWFRPTMIRTGPDGALWIADMYRAVIEHPEWIPPEYQRKMNLYAGNDRGRIYRIVPAGECCGETSASGRASALRVSANDTAASAEAKPESQESPNAHGGLTPNRSPERDGYFDQPWNEIPIADLVKRLESRNGWWRDTAQRILMHRNLESFNDVSFCLVGREAISRNPRTNVAVQGLKTMYFLRGPDTDEETLLFVDLVIANHALTSNHSDIRALVPELCDRLLKSGHPDGIGLLTEFAEESGPTGSLKLLVSLGEAKGDTGAKLLGKMLRESFDDTFLRSAGLTSLNPDNISGVLNEALNVPPSELNEELIGILIAQAAAMGRGESLGEPLTRLVESIDEEAPAARFDSISEAVRKVLRSDVAPMLKLHKDFEPVLGDSGTIAWNVAKNESADADRRAAALRFADVAGKLNSAEEELSAFLTPKTPTAVQMAVVQIMARSLDPAIVSKLVSNLNTLEPAVHSEVLTLLLQREPTIETVLTSVANETLTESDFNATQLDGLLNHRNEAIAERAKSLLSHQVNSTRAAVVDDFKSQISSLKSNAAAGRIVFEKRCGACHRLQDVGKEVGADLAALKDRSTDALLTAILDPNKAVESKFLTYTVVTKDGLQHSGMLKGETGGSLTLIGNDGKETTVARADIDELVGSKRSLMPEGLEKDLSAQDLVNVMAFVQSTGTPWKRFEGNSPQFVNANPDRTITLPASAAEIYGPSLVFERQYGNLGFWSSTEDYAKWTFEVPTSGHWTVEFDFACDDSTAGSLIKLSTGNRLLSARVPGSGTWDHYQTWQAGTIDLHRGRGQLIVTAPEKPSMALIDLRAIRLIPPK